MLVSWLKPSLTRFHQIAALESEVNSTKAKLRDSEARAEAAEKKADGEAGKFVEAGRKLEQQDMLVKSLKTQVEQADSRKSE